MDQGTCQAAQILCSNEAGCERIDNRNRCADVEAISLVIGLAGKSETNIRSNFFWSQVSDPCLIPYKDPYLIPYLELFIHPESSDHTN